MEEWGFIDDAELQGWKGVCICMTCQHFTYGVDQHCHKLLVCALRHQTEAAATGPAPTEEVQAMGTHLALGNGLGTRGWLE